MTPAKSQQKNRLSRRGFLKATAAVSLASTFPAFAASRERILAYIGTYTGAIGNGGNGEGIYSAELNPVTGELVNLKLAVATPSPSWIAISPSGKFLYAANELVNYHGNSGSVSSFSIDPSSGALTYINTVDSNGGAPAHLSVEAQGRFVFVANYMGGTISVLPVALDGSLKAASYIHKDEDEVGAKRAATAPTGSFAISGHESPHPHMIQPSPDGRFVLYTDLAQDRIYIQNLDPSSGKLTNAEKPYLTLPSGDGPRHFVFHPNGRWFYSIQEEASTLTFFLYEPTTGSLRQEQTVATLPPGFVGTNMTSEIAISPDGKFLYAANRLHDSISVHAIAANGRLAYVGFQSTLGDYPRHFNFSPDGSYLFCCNQRSDAITSFQINRRTGLLTPTGRYLPVGSPSCIVFHKQ